MAFMIVAVADVLSLASGLACRVRLHGASLAYGDALGGHPRCTQAKEQRFTEKIWIGKRDLLEEWSCRRVKI